MTKKYKEKEPNIATAEEPAVVYNTAQKKTTKTENNDIPLGYMSLERFGEIFHQKLDDCYENLSSGCL